MSVNSYLTGCRDLYEPKMQMRELSWGDLGRLDRETGAVNARGIEVANCERVGDWLSANNVRAAVRNATRRSWRSRPWAEKGGVLDAAKFWSNAALSPVVTAGYIDR